MDRQQRKTGLDRQQRKTGLDRQITDEDRIG